MPVSPTVMFSRVRLARNYWDLPFDLSARTEDAEALIARTSHALVGSARAEDLELKRIRDMSPVDRQMFEESHLITRDLLKHPDTAAAMLNEKCGISVLMNEEDHVRILCVQPGLELLKAADACFHLDDMLSMSTQIAFDPELGYLTACPTNTGTGLRASLIVHLPMLTRSKQMGNVGQTVAKLGMAIRGVYGEGSDSLGNIYQISNHATLGRTEEEILASVLTVGQQLSDMEKQVCEKQMESDRIPIEDAVYRAVGILTHARTLSLNEFFLYWSNLRLGIMCGILPVSVSDVDHMIEEVQWAHLSAYAQHELSQPEQDIVRAARVRDMMALL